MDKRSPKWRTVTASPAYNAWLDSLAGEFASFARACRRTRSAEVVLVCIDVFGARQTPSSGGYFSGLDTTLLPQTPTENKARAPLSAVERWRYDSCREEAAKAPTTVGVNRGFRLCDERFGQ